MKISNRARTLALGESFGTQSTEPPQSLRWWFGVALWDALTPITGEAKLIDQWPEWPRPTLAHGETFELQSFKLELGA